MGPEPLPLYDELCAALHVLYDLPTFSPTSPAASFQTFSQITGASHLPAQTLCFPNLGSDSTLIPRSGILSSVSLPILPVQVGLPHTRP